MLSVIIPLYNERRTIDEILRRVVAVPIEKQIIIVDDASDDGTREFLKAHEARKESFPGNRFEYVYCSRNRGKGAAIREGISRVTESITLIQDADLEYDPADYPKLIDPILKGRADVVYGSRFTGADRRVLYFWHTIANQWLTLVSNILTNCNLTDMETGYKAFRSTLLKGIPLRSNRFGFEPEITAKVAKLGCRIYEVPISYYGRTYAQGKKIRLKDAVTALITMIRFWLIDDLYTEDVAGVRTLNIMQGASEYNAWLAKIIKPWLGNRIVEMGSGIGNMTPFFIDREHVVATDVSDSHILELRREFGNYHNVAIEKVNFNDRNSIEGAISKPVFAGIDTVVSMNVLEHIEHDDIALRGCFSILADGGRLVLLVPAHMSLYSEMDRRISHFRRYNRKRLRSLVREAGFSVIHERYCNMLGAFGWFVNGRILRRKLLPSRQIRLFNILSSVLALEKYFNPPFGLGLLMVAEKRPAKQQ